MKSAHRVQEKEGVRHALKDLLDEISSLPETRASCCRCGKEMDCVDFEFALCGESDEWNIRVPICGCQNLAEA